MVKVVLVFVSPTNPSMQARNCKRSNEYSRDHFKKWYLGTVLDYRTTFINSSESQKPIFFQDDFPYLLMTMMNVSMNVSF